MQDTPTPHIQEGEIVSDTTNQPTTTSVTTPSSSVPAFDINAYNATLDIVRRRITLLEKAKTELKTLKEMYDDTFLNNEEYVKAEAEIKEVSKKKKDVQAQLSKQSQTVELKGKMTDLKEHIKENEESLSDELMEYYRTSGVMEIETEDGNVQEFTITVRLKSKKRAEK